MYAHMQSVRLRPLFALLAGMVVLVFAAGSVDRAHASDDGQRGSGFEWKAGGKPVLGPQPFAIILCKFKDKATRPNEPQYYKDLFGIGADGSTNKSTFGTVDHYFRQVSNGFMNLNGSVVFDWVTMAGNEADYYEMKNGKPVPSISHPDLFSQNYTKLATDCAAAADANGINPNGSKGVDFSKFKGLALFFNSTLDGRSGGMPLTLKLENVTRTDLPVNWFNIDGSGRFIHVTHEMGHSFGLNHSSGPYDDHYDSEWDLMSEGGDCSIMGSYGCLAAHTIAAHKAHLGWIPAERIFNLQPGAAQTVTMSRSAFPVSAGCQPGKSACHMAKLPIRGDARKYYTVELRTSAGYGSLQSYDENIPGSAVLIHKVDETVKQRNAQVVDRDNNKDPNDDEAMYRQGETFTDTANGISVKVETLDVNAGTARIVLTQLPSITVNEVTVQESFSGSQATFTVKLNKATNVPVTVKYATANGTAIAGSDYTATSGTLTIPAGATSATVKVVIRLDSVKESNETFFLNLSAPTNAILIDGKATATIQDQPLNAPQPCPVLTPDCVEK